MATDGASDVEVTIQVDRTASDRFDAIVQALAASGLADVASHKRFLIVNGSISPDALDRLREVPGVQSVRQSRTYRAQ